MREIDLDSDFKVIVFGLGSLGSNTVLSLSRRLGDKVGFYLVDYDIIEEKNLANQPWMDVNVNQKKITVLSANLWRISKCKALCHHKKIVTVSDVKHLPYIEKADLMVDCFDNTASRKVLKRAAQVTKKDIIHSGFSENSFKCAWNDNFRLIGNSRNPICDRRDLATIVQLGAALTAEAIYYYLTNNKKLSYYLDIIKGSLKAFNIE